MKIFLLLVAMLVSQTCIFGKANLSYIPVPDSVADVEKAVIPLDGTWKFSLSPSKQFWLNSVNPYSWTDIDVPGECLMQGFNIKQDIEYAYKKELVIPPDFKNKQIHLLFNGVYSYARVWINGRFVRDHHGGFTSWVCDITDYISFKDKNWLTVGVTDRSDEISWGSSYAKHNIGGIIRSVQLYALPKVYITQLLTRTHLDKTYSNTELHISLKVRFVDNKTGQVNILLTDPNNNPVKITKNILITSNQQEYSLQIPVNSPKLWDAEHPNLYKLFVDVMVNDQVVERLSHQIGFREIERKGNRLLVNGQPITLKGVNRHSVHPLWGRVTTPELDEKDAQLFKEANVNFIRTSHYPPTKAFLQACDQYGLYVEEEAAVCFVNTHGNRATSENPKYTDRYLGQCIEMVECDINHPSVIMWSLGNESMWGRNFKSCLDYIRQQDSTRPIIFSYPRSVPPNISAFDIYSWHYISFDENLNFPSIQYPVLHDEFAHVACYNTDELKRDPNVRNFWGHSIKRFAEEFYQKPGVLGGAIWGGIDEVFQLPVEPEQLPDQSGRFSKYGYGEWGIIDGWRRKKPEHWLTKKAFSPIKIQDKFVFNPGNGKPIKIPIENRFDHTNLQELEFRYRIDTDPWKNLEITLEPHQQGNVFLKPRNWKNWSIIHLQFHKNNNLIDEFKLELVPWAKPKRTQPRTLFQHLGSYKKIKTTSSDKPPVLAIQDRYIEIYNQNFSITFDRHKGLLSNGKYKGQTLIHKGPYLFLDDKSLEPWSVKEHGVEIDSNVVKLSVHGCYGELGVQFIMRVDRAGLIQTKYILEHIPEHMKGVNFGNVGVYFVISEQVDRIEWHRNALWSVYPDHHIGRNHGIAYKIRKQGAERYRQKPIWPYAHDMNNFYLNGPFDPESGCTNDFKSMKENIWYLSALLGNSDVCLRVESNGRDAGQLQVMDRDEPKYLKLIISNEWNYPNLKWGNYMKDPILIRKGYSDGVNVRLTDRSPVLKNITNQK